MHKYKTDIQGRSNKRWGPCLQRYQMNCHKQWPLLFPQTNRMLNFVYLFYLCSWFSFLNGNTVMAVIWSLCIFLVCDDLFVGPFLVGFFQVRLENSDQCLNLVKISPPTPLIFVCMFVYWPVFGCSQGPGMSQCCSPSDTHSSHLQNLAPPHSPHSDTATWPLWCGSAWQGRKDQEVALCGVFIFIFFFHIKGIHRGTAGIY